MATDRMSAIFVIVACLAGIFLLIPAGAERIDYGSLSPDQMPTILCWIMIALAAAQLVWVGPSEQPRLPDLSEFLRAVFMFFVTIVGALLITTLGFLVVSICIATTAALMTGERRPQWIALGGFGLPAIVWFVSVYVLDRNLPAFGG